MSATILNTVSNSLLKKYLEELTNEKEIEECSKFLFTN